VGCFTYSPVAGAAANALADPVPESVKLDRQEQLMELQAEISAAKLAERVGTRIEVLVDEVRGDRAVARSRGDAPDVDGVVNVSGARGLTAGERAWVRVTSSDEHDLTAEYVGAAVRFA
jgi:ribosomal protein S12 methylthiotransferase